MNTNYLRVIPRDLFNESKLLKCIGRLVLLILDCKQPDGLTYEHDDEPFIIGLWDDGHLEVENIIFKVNDTRVRFKSQYNSKSAFPLLCVHEYCEYPVFEDLTGEFTDEFIQFCKTL